MAFLVGKLTLTNSCKEQIARQCAKVLVELLSKSAGRAASLKALYNLSGLDDNATILVDSALLPALTDILFKSHDASPELKGLAAATIANVASNPGCWELASADKLGHSMQSESIVSSLLGLLSGVSPQCQVSTLRILCGIASSPQAAGNSLLTNTSKIHFLAPTMIPSFLYKNARFSCSNVHEHVKLVIFIGFINFSGISVKLLISIGMSRIVGCKHGTKTAHVNYFNILHKIVQNRRFI